MKLAAASFLVVLLAAHAEGDSDALRRPLSQFRDGPGAWLGYLLFGLLLLVGGVYTAALARLRCAGEAKVAGAAVLLLALVAATPSLGAFHHLCSLMLLLLLFAHFGVLLLEGGTPLIVAHLTMPAALACATGLHSYGLWQKSFIVYCVLSTAVHHHLLGRPALARRVARRAPVLATRRRKVYALEDGAWWVRRG